MARVGKNASPAAAAKINPVYFIGQIESAWQTFPVPGVRVKNLFVDEQRGRSTKLDELGPGANFPGHHHSPLRAGGGPAQILTLSTTAIAA